MLDSCRHMALHCIVHTVANIALLSQPTILTNEASRHHNHTPYVSYFGNPEKSGLQSSQDLLRVREKAVQWIVDPPKPRQPEKTSRGSDSFDGGGT